MFSGRCFAFGCSFTNWFYPTWADFIGINFNNFYNFAKGGTSNTLMFQRLIEVDQIYKFEKTDTILWGLTNLSRHNFFVQGREKTFLFGCGALNKPDQWFEEHHKYKEFSDIIKFTRDQYWKEKWGIYYTWIAVSNVKRLCEAIGCRLIIIPAMNIDIWEDTDHIITDATEQKMLNEIKKSLTIQLSLQDFDQKNYKKPKPILDQHPFVDANWGYVNKHMPEFVTTKGCDYFNELWSVFLENSKSNKYKDETEVWTFLQHYKKEQNDWRDDLKLYGEYI